jgi:transposase
MKQGVFNAVRIHRELADAGYDGGITILRDFMAPHRPVYRAKVTPRFETEPGRQAQVDVGHFTYRNPEGRLRKTYCLAMVLGYSRMLYVEFLPRPGQMEILKAIRNAFDYLGGVPHEILSDNASSLVRKAATKDRPVEWSETYLDFARHFGFVPRACRAYWARGKGKVERPIRYIRDSFWPTGFEDLGDLNRQVIQWLEGTANIRIHGTTYEQPVRRWAAEKLDPVNPRPYVISSLGTRRVSNDCLVSWNARKYSAPWPLAGHDVRVREFETGVLAVEHEGAAVARHEVAGEACGPRIQQAHYEGMPRAGGRTPGHAVGAQTSPEVQKRSLEIYDRLAGVNLND